MPSYPLLGGPCDGRRSANFTSEPATGTTVACGGATYRYDRGNPNVFVWLQTSGVGGGAGGGFAGGAHQLDASWRRLMRAYGVTMPRALRRSAAGRHRMKRVVR